MERTKQYMDAIKRAYTEVKNLLSIVIPVLIVAGSMGYSVKLGLLELSKEHYFAVALAIFSLTSGAIILKISNRN